MNAEELRFIFKLAPKRHPEYEEEIFKDRALVVEYMTALVHGSNPSKQNREDTDVYLGYTVYNFSSLVLRRRWSVAEPFIMTNSVIAYLYAKDVIKGRWQEAEQIILSNEKVRYQYFDLWLHEI